MADETPKLHVIPKADDADFEKALAGLREMARKSLQTAPLLAQIRRTHYLAHIDAGFTPAEALELVKGI